MRTRFVPIVDFKPEINSLNLEQSAWVLKWSDGDYSVNKRIDFTGEKWHSTRGPNVAITHEKGIKYKYQENEKWALKQIQGEWFLTLTHLQSDPIVYQINKVYQDSIKLRCLSWETEQQFTLHHLGKISQSQANSIINHLCKKKWETSEVLNYSTSFSEHATTIDEELTTGSSVRDTTLIKRSELIDKKVSFNFRSDFTFQILVDSNLYWQTKWRLSADGAYVILNNGRHPYNYIEIISIGKDELVIGKSDNFGSDKEEGDYFPYYYELRLK
jgi:hypothetical protein